MNPNAAFARHTRPELARIFRAVNLDMNYLSGEGDYLVRESPAGSGVEHRVLDLVGGFGASLFGHNHPELVAVARRCFDDRIPFNAQGSVRAGAGALAERLSAVVGESTGASYVVTFGSTGADAVEAAMKHAAVASTRRLGAVQEAYERNLRLLRREGVAETPCADGPAAGRPCGEAVREAIAAVVRLRKVEPIFVSLRNAFHGKTSGANTLTQGRDVPKDLHVAGPKHRRLYDWSPRGVVIALDAERVPVCEITVDADGVPHSATRHLSPVAACFAEPVQGEAGVREVPAATLAALRELADRHDAALVFDEIQCGMGRTGTFLASEPSGVVADYYLLSKSLGGGLTKISALMIDERAYVPEFGRHHTSTFADDDLSARVGLAAVELSRTYRDRIVEIGGLLRERLEEVAARWPKAVVAVRGRGLLLGVEFKLTKPKSTFLRTVFDNEALGFLISGRMLHAHSIRVVPTLSAPTTIRVQPSALLGESEVDLIAAAFDDVARILSTGDYAALLAHVTEPADDTWRPRQHVPYPRGDKPAPARRASVDVPCVVFLANLDAPSTIRTVAPELAGWSDEQCANAFDRLWAELPPFEVARREVTSASGAMVDVSFVAVPFTATQAVDGLRAGHGPWLRRMVLDAVELGYLTGADVIGLGGYTSIVTAAGRDVVESDVRITSGNSLTAACAYDLLRAHLAGSEPGERRVGLVGGLGNIGAVMAELVAPHCESLVLVGRPGSGRRLAAVAKRLADLVDVTIAEDVAALRDCPVVVSATNAADPVILPNHLAGDRDVLVCDLAVPGDVHPAVASLPNVTLVSGGRIALPGGQQPKFPGITLPPGILYSCMAETILLGFERGTESPSYGGLSVSGVLAARELAVRHGLHPARIVADDVSVRPWMADGLRETIEEHVR